MQLGDKNSPTHEMIVLNLDLGTKGALEAMTVSLFSLGVLACCVTAREHHSDISTAGMGEGAR